MRNTFISGIFDYSYTEFKRHFDKDDNDRIIFSARYGMGKTTFLSEYFSSANQESWNEKYQVYRLFPVNYSISSNDDIIQYIKYDLIFEILKTNPDLDKSAAEILNSVPKYVKENLGKVAAALLYMVPKIGKDVSEAFEKINGVVNEFLKESESAGDKMVDYLEQIHNQQGGLYEYDVLTKLIINTPPKAPNNKKVLIVDDIDRLDPEHVFRILNVFAAHFDNQIYGRGNKFQFDKVIIVCDFNNIKNLFQHRYGSEADFMGYIDKFYSSEVFKFDNQRALENTVETILYEIKPTTSGSDNINVIRQIYLRDDFVINMIVIFLRIKRVSLRNVLKMRGKIIDFHYDLIYKDKSHNITANISRIACQLRLITDILGDVDHFLDSLQGCRNNIESFKEFTSFIPELMAVTVLSSRKMNFGQPFLFELKGNKYKISHDSNRLGFNIENVLPDDLPSQQPFNPALPTFWDSVISATLELKKTGYLR